MDPVTAAIIAALVGWASILLVVRLPAPRKRIAPTGVRRLGAAAISLMALSAFGVPVPMWVPLAVFALGFGLLVLFAPQRAQT